MYLLAGLIFLSSGTNHRFIFKPTLIFNIFAIFLYFRCISEKLHELYRVNHWSIVSCGNNRCWYSWRRAVEFSGIEQSWSSVVGVDWSWCTLCAGWWHNWGSRSGGSYCWGNRGGWSCREWSTVIKKRKYI